MRVDQRALAEDRADGANRPWLAGVVSPPAVSSIRNAIRIAPMRRRGRHVREARRLIVGLGEVERDLRARDRDRDRDPVALGRIEAVGDHPALAAVGAIGPALQLGPYLALGSVDDVVHVRVEALDAVAREHIDEAALADRARADHRLDVLGDDVEPDVRAHEIPHVAPQHAAVLDLQRRDPERLLPDLARAGVVATGGHAADVGDVALARGPRDELAVEEDREEDTDVRVLVAAAVDVVVDEDIAVVQVVAEVLDDPLQRRLSAVRDDRGVLGLRERAAGAVEDHRH